MAFLSPSPIEIVVILVIALLVLGPSRLPETARSIGRGMRELRDSLQGIGGDDDPDDLDRRRDDPGGLPVMLPEGEGNDLDEDSEYHDGYAEPDLSRRS